ncbi:MAG TPA: ABC transporter ATP-binding protein [Candidatus Methylomirabilis sp.]|nr:ABC transporter ATP-binding protein [Candidatus Methylomirabilis sp.]
MAGLELRNVTKRFGDITALDALSLTVEHGEFFVVVGPNGSGKTTLLRVVAGLIAPDAGDVYIGGVKVTHLPPAQRGVRMVFHTYALFPHLKVYDERRLANLNFPLKIRRFLQEEIAKVISGVARRVGIEKELYPRRPDQLSAGQKQKVAVGRALAIPPKIFVLDEPLSNLDPLSRVTVREELRRIHNEIAATTLYVTHNLPEALAMADRLAVLNRGAIQQIGPPRDVYARPANEFVKVFIHSYDLPAQRV